MKRRVGLAVRGAARIVREVLGRVPAAQREVDAAHESDGIVDEDDFLVLAAGDRMRIVVTQTHPVVRRPAEAVERRNLAIGAEHDGIVPVQHVDAQAAAAPDEEVQELAEQRGRRAARLGIEMQPRLAVEVPGEDRNRARRAQRGVVERLEIGLRIDEQRDAVRARHRAAIVADAQHARALGAAGTRGFPAVLAGAGASGVV